MDTCCIRLCRIHTCTDTDRANDMIDAKDIKRSSYYTVVAVAAEQSAAFAKFPARDNDRPILWHRSLMDTWQEMDNRIDYDYEYADVTGFRRM